MSPKIYWQHWDWMKSRGRKRVTEKKNGKPKPAENPIEEIENRSERNLWLWRLNETTHPDHVRPVKIGGREFSSIETYYQIKKATETFGPVGIGWGWALDEDVIEVPGKDGRTIVFAKARVTLWYIDDHSSEKVYCGPVVGMNQLVAESGRPDDEAFKKATSDGITKALSYLGFSADVFMGKWDDNKYVSELRKQANQKLDATGSRLPEVCTKAVASLPGLKDEQELTITWKALQDDLKKLSPPQLDFMKARFARRRNELTGGVPAEADGSDPSRQ